jgi:curved DNA-binding protein CbpA
MVDYYESLQVHYLAESEVIEAAYKKLAYKYHPDRNKSASAAEKMKIINVAHDILCDPIKRHDYDITRLRNPGDPGTGPKPVVDPNHIEFKNVEAGRVIKASFTVFNTGGHYSKINISNPDSWVKVVAWHSLSTTDELPLKVDVEAIGKEWYKRYTEVIRINLDTIQTSLDILLTTRLRLEITDHVWHNIEFENLKPWIKKRKDILDTGEIQRGKTFRYRLNKATGKYQFRLRRDYPRAIYDPGQE